MSPATSRPIATLLEGLFDEPAAQPVSRPGSGGACELIPAAVLVVLREGDAPGAAEPGEPTAASLGELRVLLTRRRAHMRRHAGEIAFPGGRHDASDASLYDTALREAEEEIGLARDRVLPLGALSVAYTFATNYAVYPFVALLGQPASAGRPPGVDSPHEHAPDARAGVAEAGAPAAPAWRVSPQEVDAVFELSLAQLEASRARERLTRRGLTFETDVFAIGEDLIWGLTQRVLEDLLQRLRPAS